MALEILKTTKIDVCLLGILIVSLAYQVRKNLNISRKPGIPPEVFRNVMGVTVGVDSKGNCIHFGKLTGGVAV